MDKDNTDVALENARDEVLRKIGRNMLLFQQMEGMLKYIVANSELSGNIDELKVNRDKRVEKVRTQTMGLLVGQYIGETLRGNEKCTEEHKERNGAYFSFTHKVECDAAYHEEREQALASIVADRNDLIHHLLPKFDPNSIKSCRETDQYLEQQREKLLPEFDLLKRMAKNLQELRKSLGEFLTSEEGKEFFASSLPRKSSVVTLLEDIAAQKARHDGWTVLDAADHLIRQHAPEEISALHERYGHKTLKELVSATEQFDIYEESTDRGGIRVLYRLKHEVHSNE